MTATAPTRPAARRLALAACLLLPAVGCYDGDALVRRVRNDALRDRLEEIDLGWYQITMPRDPRTTETLEVEMHLFGSLARYRQAEVGARLKEKNYLLRHATLMIIRKTNLEDFADPDLTKLRDRIRVVTNQMLDEPSIQTVGFHEIRFMRH